MDPQVAVFGNLRFPPGRIDEVREHLKVLVDATVKLDGCLSYEVAEDLFDPGLVRVSELWPDAGSLQRHFDAPHLLAWRAAAKSCGLIDRQFTAYNVGSSRPL